MMIRSIKILLTFAITLVSFGACGDSHSKETYAKMENMCEKLPMQSDGIVRLSKIQVNPDYLDEYIGYAKEVGSISLETEPGVLTMYAVADKENPCNITILETYSSQEAYKSHIASDHFQKYKQGTLHMVDSLLLDDVTPLNPNILLTNTIKK
ncbi:MAG: antibiotic biosynthesis monooxygenase [Muribaculaceae bacterium]|nr:antibiotic biosynthesis monooxygenase [Muribaculaceae bacterium]